MRDMLSIIQPLSTVMTMEDSREQVDINCHSLARITMWWSCTIIKYHWDNDM